MDRKFESRRALSAKSRRGRRKEIRVSQALAGFPFATSVPDALVDAVGGRF
jgi:hypothetical protein